MSIEGTFAAVQKVVWIMNLPTDLPERQALNRARRSKTGEYRQDLLKTMTRSDEIPADVLAIQIGDIHFSYSDNAIGTTVETVQASAVNTAGGMVIEQGQLVSIVGRPGSGKS